MVGVGVGVGMESGIVVESWVKGVELNIGPKFSTCLPAKQQLEKQQFEQNGSPMSNPRLALEQVPLSSMKLSFLIIMLRIYAYCEFLRDAYVLKTPWKRHTEVHSCSFSQVLSQTFYFFCPSWSLLREVI